jgi:hypothetical protein
MGATLAMTLGLPASLAGGIAVVNEAQKLIASDGMPSDKFGIAIEREGDTLIIGAPQHYTSSLPGSFYIFTRDGAGQWNEQARVMSDFQPGEAEFGDLFGEELALDGDTLLVGAPFAELDGAMLVGRVYVFKRDPAGVWVEQQTLLPEDAGVIRFGEHMALVGDRAIITSAYKAFVFGRDNNGVWSQLAVLPDIDFDFIGPVSFDGQRIIVANGPAQTAGPRALVFANDGKGWAVVDSIDNLPQGVMQTIGNVALDGDRVALGVIDAAVQDRAFVYEQAQPPAWTQQAMLDPNNLDNDSFGADIELAGNTLLVGANHAGANGITYFYTRDSNGAWAIQAQLEPSDNYPDNFGDEIHYDDGMPVIGSWAHHENGLYAGAVYVFDVIPVPVSGDVTGDGVVNIADLLAVIGAWGPCAPSCPADVAPSAGDGVVNVQDLLFVIASWG